MSLFRTVTALRTPAMALTLLLPLLAATPAQASQQATVIKHQDCKYLLLNSRQGMVIVRQLSGGQTQTGDTLSGDFSPGDFSELQNRRTNESMSVWVDMVDRQSTRALNQYGRYCS